MLTFAYSWHRVGAAVPHVHISSSWSFGLQFCINVYNFELTSVRDVPSSKVTERRSKFSRDAVSLKVRPILSQSYNATVF